VFSLALFLIIPTSFADDFSSSDVNVDGNTPSESVNNDPAQFEEDSTEDTLTSESDGSTDTADINITQSASNYNPNYHDYVNFTVTLNNNGPDTANDITASYLLNNHYLKWISDDGKILDDGTDSYNYQTGVWSVGTLDSGTNITLHIMAQIITSNTMFSNLACYLSGSTVDPNSDNNVSEIILTVPPTADILVSQIASKYNPTYCHHIYIRFSVRNLGPDTAQNIVVNCGLNPNQLKFLSCFGAGYYNYKTGIWTITSLNSGSTINLYIKTKIMAFNKVIKNIVSYQPSTYDSYPTNNRATVSLTIPNITLKLLIHDLAIDTQSKYDRAVNIFNWVRDYIDYSFYYNTRYGAVKTYKYRKGNCADMAHLIVYLARASGLSARYRCGLCFFKVSRHWIGHVWVNIYVRGPKGLKWYTADASNNNNDFGIIRSWVTSNFISRGTYYRLPF
jgi:uncharacterized repeat protein (TIGR01451 family)